ncbi:MAG: PAS domain-containing protein [Anaerosomatales bacterium]|nr:PAS domain-containing protein [Anaerosomatales bacterium]
MSAFAYDQWAQVLLDAAPIGISIGRPDGEIVFYNPAWERISGYSAQEARDHGWFELAYPDPEERRRAIEVAMAAIEGALRSSSWKSRARTAGGSGRSSSRARWSSTARPTTLPS